MDTFISFLSTIDLAAFHAINGFCGQNLLLDQVINQLESVHLKGLAFIGTFGALWFQRTKSQVQQKEYSIRKVDDPKLFVEFYLKNLNAKGRANRIDFSNFYTLFSETSIRDCGIILAAFLNDVPIAMTFLVWGHGTMYYLLSTRAVDGQDHGAVSLLIWNAMLRAHELGVVLDLDGVYSSGTVRFLSNFGGKIKTRLIIRRSRMPYRALQHVKRYFVRDETHRFT
jgi:hypothetical protein